MADEIRNADNPMAVISNPKTQELIADKRLQDILEAGDFVKTTQNTKNSTDSTVMTVDEEAFHLEFIDEDGNSTLNNGVEFSKQARRMMKDGLLSPELIAEMHEEVV